jgi:Fur family ferric uptake transcriptional regulator
VKQNLTISYDDYIIKFKGMIKSLGLNNSIQREYVLKVLFDCNKHLSAEQILAKIRSEYGVKIGIATIYRILGLLEDMNIINSLSVNGSDAKVYEISLVLHHDHLVCVSCGKIIEFMNETIENLQKDVAIENNFKLQTHNMILYGICKECQEDE